MVFIIGDESAPPYFFGQLITNQPRSASPFLICWFSAQWSSRDSSAGPCQFMGNTSSRNALNWRLKSDSSGVNSKRNICGSGLVPLAGFSVLQLPTDRHVTVFTIPGTRCIPSVIRSPMPGRSSASAMAMISNGPVTVSTAFISGIFFSASATSLVLPTAVSIRMYARGAR